MSQIERKYCLEVRVAKSAGFCFGVERAVNKVYEQVRTGKKNVYTFGPIIHNEEVVKDLEEKGIRVLHSKEELIQLTEGTVIIRSHGVCREIYDLLEEKGLEVVDATCPFVRKIHRIVKEDSAKGRTIIIIGDSSHPEVEGIRGWSSTPAAVVETPEDVEELDFLPDTPVTIVSQTTFNNKKFQDIVEKILEKRYDSIVVNTICNATSERQTEAKAIASDVEAMIVIGGKHSSNTQKLYEICKKECKNTYYIQTLEDLAVQDFQAVRTVGITAGASTPKNIIEEVQANVRVKF